MTQAKKVYLVGGAVRDELLGRAVHDRDYVVVGSTHEEMIEQGFTQVGAAFPVYLHPETKEEYALARTERKTGSGHKGFETFFSPDVTLEEDLSRRDLTINAMAKDVGTGEIIDPFGGQQDISKRILRHTTEAFLDDPLRILRLYRFRAQLGISWRIDWETAALCFQNWRSLSEISAERKWKEMEKALNSAYFISYVYSLSYLNQLPELTNLRGVQQPVEHHPEGDAFIHTLMCLEQADRQIIPQVKFAVLCHDFGKAVTYEKYGNLYGHEGAGVPLVEKFCESLRVPNDYARLALKVTEYHTKIHSVMGRGESKPSKAKSVMKLFEELGVVGERHEDFLDDVIASCVCDARGRTGKWDAEYPQGKYLKSLWKAMMAVRSKDVSYPLLEKGVSGPLIGEAIRVARINAIRQAMKEA